MSKQKSARSRSAHGFKICHGYNSIKTGNYWVFIGVTDFGLLCFWRSFARELQYLEPKHALRCFDPSDSKGENLNEYDEVADNLNEYAII